MAFSKSDPRGLTWIFLGVATLACAVVLFCFDPAVAGFYPICMFHRITGLQCPGCGGLRAAHQLLRGNIAAAYHLNALVVFGAPLAVAFTVRQVLRALRHQPASFEIRPSWLWTGIAVLVVFGIARNLM